MGKGKVGKDKDGTSQATWIIFFGKKLKDDNKM